MKKYLLPVFILVSIGFLTRYYMGASPVAIPSVTRPSLFLVSTILLAAGFFFDVFALKKMLDSCRIVLPFQRIIAGTGLTIFGKYIPGKIWSSLGSAAFMARGTGYTAPEIALYSLYYQLLILWGGLAMGSCGLLFFPLGVSLKWSIGSIAAISLILILLPSRKGGLGGALSFLLRKKIEIPIIAFSTIVKTLFWVLLAWVAWGSGFYCFAASMTVTFLPLYFIFVFPFAAVIGVAALFAPGGLGVREGIIAASFGCAGFDIAYGITMAALSRIWFLAGEILHFLAGFILSRKRDNGQNE